MSLKRILFRIAGLVVFVTFILNVIRVSDFHASDEALLLQSGAYLTIDLQPLILRPDRAIIMGKLNNNPWDDVKVECCFYDAEGGIVDCRTEKISDPNKIFATIDGPQCEKVKSASVELFHSETSVRKEWSLPETSNQRDQDVSIESK